MTDILIISCSLNPLSKSRMLARKAFEYLRSRGTVDWLDLNDLSLPMCDGDTVYGDPEVQRVSQKIANAKAVLMAVPVYNYYANAASKNLIELTGQAWQDKVVGFLCAAGGRSSYMAVMSLANSLMLDFRCLIVPRFVYADGSAFSSNEVTDLDVVKRIEELGESTLKLSALNSSPRAMTAV